MSSYSLGKVSVAGVVSASSDGLLELVVSDDGDDASLSGVTSGAISCSASAMIEGKKMELLKLSLYFSLGMNYTVINLLIIIEGLSIEISLSEDFQL